MTLHGEVVHRFTDGEGSAAEIGLRFVEPTTNISGRIREYVKTFITETEDVIE